MILEIRMGEGLFVVEQGCVRMIRLGECQFSPQCHTQDDEHGVEKPQDGRTFVR